MRSGRVLRISIARLVLLAGLWLSAIPAQGAPPTLTRVYPAGGQRGAKIAVTCTGEFNWPVNVWAPGIDVTVAADAGKLEIAIPQELAADRVWIRLYNSEGISAPFPFLIGNLPEVVEQEPNDESTSGKVLEQPSAVVNGVLERSGDVDGFTVSLKAGQTLVAALDAHGRLGSPMDAILQISTTDGFVVAENHDDIGLDPLIVFQAPRDEQYVVRLFAFPSEPDTGIAFRGGANYLYRLTLTTGPFATHALPMTVSQTELPSVKLLGWNLPDTELANVTPCGGTDVGDYLERDAFADGRSLANTRNGCVATGSAGHVRIRLAPFPGLGELSATNSQQPLLVSVPAALMGWIKEPRQTDLYRLALSKDQPVVVAVESRGLNLGLHPVVSLTHPGGATVASGEPNEPQDVVLRYTPDQDGEFLLKVGDRYRRGGERCFYQLTVRADQPDFELALASDAIVLTPEKPAELPITVQRRGQNVGPITIEASGLPEGITCATVTSNPADDTNGKVTLVFNSAGPAFSGPVRIIGTASEPHELRRLAHTPAILGASFEYIWLTNVSPPTN